jgi:Xaa-Pro dipeptidase
MSNGPDTRVSALDSALEDAGLDAVLVTKDASIAYFSGFWGLQLERFFGVVVRPGGAALIAPSLDRESVTAAPGGLGKVMYAAGVSNGLPELFEQLDGARRIGVEEDHLIHARSSALAEAGFELVPASDVVMRLREAKAQDEYEAVRAACTHIQAVYDELWSTLKVGDVEADVNAKADYMLMRRGARAAGSHILFGRHAADSHGTPDARTLQAGDVICADISAQFDGYWGDMTRVGFAGEPSSWARSAWDVVKEAYDAAVAACRPGVTTRAVDAAQRDVVSAHPEIGEVLHGAGHAIGLEIHEPPFLVPNNTATLREGMIFTIEPGIYNSEQGGIRLEDDVLVGPDGPVMLSDYPLELRVVG